MALLHTGIDKGGSAISEGTTSRQEQRRRAAKLGHIYLAER